MSYDMFDMEYHTSRELTPQEEARLQTRMQNLPAFIEDAPYLVEELAELSGVPNPQEAAKDLDALLPILDARWKWEDFQEFDKDDRVWYDTRLMYFIGEWLINRCEGRWFVPENPESEVFALYAVGYFSHGLPHDTVIVPISTAQNYVQQPPGRSLINELERVWRAALAMDQGLRRVSRRPDQMEHARQAIVEERSKGHTARRCMICNAAFSCQEDHEDEDKSYRIRCEGGCFEMTIYDLDKPLGTPNKVTVIISDEEGDTKL